MNLHSGAGQTHLGIGRNSFIGEIQAMVMPDARGTAKGLLIVLQERGL